MPRSELDNDAWWAEQKKRDAEAQKEIYHKATSEIVCPYCGTAFTDSREYIVPHTTSGEETCFNDDCEKDFYWSADISVDFSTSKKEL